MFISYDYYRTFYYVAKYKSFTHAANVLMSNQPNVTRTIKLLETELSCPLFIRSSRGVTLTQEGEKLYEYVSSAVELLQKGEEELTLSKTLQEGIISIGVTETALQGFLLPILGEFRRTYPNIHVKIANYSTPQAVAAVKNGLVDFAIVTTPVESCKFLKQKRLTDFGEVLVGGKDFEFLKSKALGFEDLKNYPLISLSQNTATFDFYNKLFAEKKLLFAPEMEAATITQLHLMVKENLGIGFLPEKLAEESLKNNELIRLTFTGVIPSRHITMIQSEEHQLTIAGKTFEKLVLEGVKLIFFYNRDW